MSHLQTRSRPLLDYLAAHDAECPGCGYNLRGNTEGACPECGRRLGLALEVGDALWRRQGLLILLFLWLVLAGTMNAVRSGRQIEATASRVAWSQVISVLPQTPGVTAAAGETFVLQELVLNSTGATSPGTIRVNVVPGTGGRMNWSNVSWSQWARLGGWTLLGGLAAAGLVLLWCGRGGRATPRLARALLALAWTGFGGYFAYHTVVFAMELV